MKELWKRKSVKVIVAVMAVVVIGLLAGIAGKSMVQKHKFTTHINSAEKYLSELDYEQAIAEYMAALEIEPNAEAVYDALEHTYLEYAQSYIDAGNYENAIAILERSILDCGREALRQMLDNTKNLLEIQRLHAAAEKSFQEAKYREAIADYEKILELDSKDSLAYIGLIEVYMEIGKPDLALEYARKGYQMTGMEQFAEKISELEKYEKTVLAILELMKTEDMDALSEIYDAENVLELVGIMGKNNAWLDIAGNDDKNTYLYFENEEKSSGGGIYLDFGGGYVFYYGGYSGGKRNGDGILYIKYSGENIESGELFHGEWMDDAPNGKGKLCEKHVDSRGGNGAYVQSIEYTGTFSNGLLDGKFEITHSYDEKSYTIQAEFQEGYAVGQEWPAGLVNHGDGSVLVGYCYHDSGVFYQTSPKTKIWNISGYY